MRHAILLGVLLAWLPAAAGAQTGAAAYIGQRVMGVDIVEEGRPVTDRAVLSLVETREGEPLAVADVRETMLHFFSLGRFQDVQVRAVEVPGGVTLHYDLIPLQGIDRVVFTGSLGLPESLLRRTVRDRFGSEPPVGRAPEVARTLEQLYVDRGYTRATVRPAPRADAGPGGGVLEFVVESGPLARIRAIELTGDLGGAAAAASRAALLNRLRIRPGEAYRRIEIQDRLSAHVQRLRRDGRYQATASHRALISEDGTAVDLVIDLQAGPVVAVAFAGDPLPRERLAELVPVEREGTADEDLLEDSLRRIEEYLHQQGYWKARATFERQEKGDRLEIVFTVRRGLQYRVEGVEVTGTGALSPDEVRPLLAVKAGDLYLVSRLDAGVAAIAQHYRARGFARVRVDSAANESNPLSPSEGLVRLVVVIAEGPRSMIGTVELAGSAAVPASELRGVIRSAPGSPYFEPQAAMDRDALLLEYLNRGFASASVQARAIFSEDGRNVDLRYEIEEGPQTLVDHVIIVGNNRTDARIIERELLLRRGEPLGLADRLESQRRLTALGLFRRVRITELAHGPATRRDVLVTVEEAPATTIGYGGGLEGSSQTRAVGEGGQAQERLEFAPRGFFEVGRRNLGGKNRSVNLFTRASLGRRDVPDDPERDGRGIGLREYRVVGTYREPRALGINADLALTAAVEQGIRSSFNFARRGMNAELLRRLSPGVRLAGRYSFSTTRTFGERLSEEEQALIDRLFPQVRVSSLSTALVRDTRDDVLNPSRGTFFSAEGTLAARAFGGQVGFAKTYLQGSWYHRLPGRRPIVFATRLATGLANPFPRDFVPEGATEPVIVEELPASERFFAGGDTTIRGFALDRVGAPDTISPAGFPLGGNAMLIMNAELRIPLWRSLGTAVFLDGGNVYSRLNDIDLGEVRGAAGFGLRYNSPIGPLRIDIGFKLDRRELGGQLERRRQLHISIGQAF